MDKFRALQYFIAAAAEGSLSGAARRLDVRVSSVAKLIDALERDCGAALFDRSSQGLTLTARGEVYLETCAPLVEKLIEAGRTVATPGAKPCGTLTMGAPPLLARMCLVPALIEFQQLYADVRIDLRTLDHMAMRQRDAMGFDVIVAPGWPGDIDMVQKALAQSRLVVCASPSYWAKHGVPQRPLDLRDHECILVRTPEGVLLDLWRQVRGPEQEEVVVRGHFVTESRDLALEAVLQGRGVGRLADLSLLRHLRDGTLQPALLDWDSGDSPPFSVLYRREARLAPQVRACVDFLIERFYRLEAECTEYLGHRPESVRPAWYTRRSRRASTSRESAKVQPCLGQEDIL
jgi:DNA-binding transcriptional LysR family regulator